MKVDITDHAIDRYRERIEPGLSYEEARERIAEGMERAIRLREKTYAGSDMWHLAGTCVFVVERCRHVHKLHPVKTVITEAEAFVRDEEETPDGND